MLLPKPDKHPQRHLSNERLTLVSWFYQPRLADIHIIISRPTMIHFLSLNPDSSAKSNEMVIF